MGHKYQQHPTALSPLPVVCGWQVRRKPGSKVGEAEIIAELANHVAKWWLPDETVFVEDELPKVSGPVRSGSHDEEQRVAVPHTARKPRMHALTTTNVSLSLFSRSPACVAAQTATGKIQKLKLREMFPAFPSGEKNVSK